MGSEPDRNAASAPGTESLSPAPVAAAAGDVSPRRTLARGLQLWWRSRRPGPVAYGWFSADEVQRLHLALAAACPAESATLDDATWRDLALDRYLDALARHTSLFGRQWLHHRLRDSTVVAPGQRLRARLQASQSEGGLDAELDAAWAALQPLRRVDIDLVGLLFTDAPVAVPGWVRWLWAVPLGFLAAAALALAGQLAVAGVLALAVLLVSARVQIVLHGPMRRWHHQRGALVMMLQAALDVAAAGTRGPLLQPVAAQAGAARALLQALRPRWADRFAALADYANLLALTQYRAWGRDMARLPALRSDLQQVFLAVAALEADLTLRGHMRHGPATCAAEHAEGRSLAFVDLVHPLLEQPHPLSMRLDGHGAFITGQNGAGKSTLLRSVGLNVVVGQAFGFCYAQQARIPRLPVATSLHVEDALATATSLYMAELERARALCRQAEQPGGALLLVDEIFRGTNPQESMAVTAALARELAASALLLLATHHRSLAPLLAPALMPLCVALDEQGAQTLQPGVLERTNGLAMLADYGFSEAMRADAGRVFDSLRADGARGVDASSTLPAAPTAP